MIKAEYKEFYEKLLEKWGEEAAYRMCIEEMAELTIELCHLMRLEKSERTLEGREKIEKVRRNIVEETADVLNLIEQIQLIFGEEEVDKIRAEKMARTKKLF